MTDFLDSFNSNDFTGGLNDFFDGFLKPINLKFQTPNQDMKPTYFEKTKNGYKATCRSVGIDSKDIDVKLKDDYIHLEGKTEMDGYTYSVSYDIPILDDIRDNIENIRYKTKNGITIIYINTKRKLKQMVDIQRIDDCKGCSAND